MKKTALFTAVLLGAILLQAEQVATLNKAAEWRNVRAFSEQEGALRVTTSAYLTSKALIPVAPSKKYRCTMKVRRAPGSAPSAFYLVFEPQNDEGRVIRMNNVTALKRTEAVLAEDAASGATQLVIRPENFDAWKAYSGACICFGAKPDYSDLPNYSISPNIKAVAPREGTEGALCITLRSPLTAAYPAGTPVRIHLGGSYIYVIQVPKTPDEWTTYEGEVQGIQTEPNWSNKSFPVKTAAFVPAIMANWGAKNTGVEIKDIVIEEL